MNEKDISNQLDRLDKQTDILEKAKQILENKMSNISNKCSDDMPLYVPKHLWKSYIVNGKLDKYKKFIYQSELFYLDDLILACQYNRMDFIAFLNQYFTLSRVMIQYQIDNIVKYCLVHGLEMTHWFLENKLLYDYDFKSPALLEQVVNKDLKFINLLIDKIKCHTKYTCQKSCIVLNYVKFPSVFSSVVLLHNPSCQILKCQILDILVELLLDNDIESVSNLIEYFPVTGEDFQEDCHTKYLWRQINNNDELDKETHDWIQQNLKNNQQKNKISDEYVLESKLF